MGDGKARLKWVYCWDHHKNGYESRKEARRARRILHPDSNMAAFECDVYPGLWHLGHMPYAVKVRGMDRDSMDAAPRSDR